MKGLGGILSFFTAAGMELSWIYPLTAVLFAAIEKPLFPFLQAAAALLLGAGVTFLAVRMNWRIIYMVLCHAVVLTLVLCRIFYIYMDYGYPFWNYLWLEKLFTGPYTPLQGLSLLLLLFSSAALYAGGICLARRTFSHPVLCTRFDVGIAALFIMLLIAGSSGVYFPQALYYLFSFFLFSIISIALARSRGSSGEFYYAYHGLGTTLTFLSVVLLLGSGVLLMILPHLIFAAEAGYTLLSRTAEPLVPVVVNILLFLFRGRGAQVEEPSNGILNGSEVTEEAQTGWWAELMEKIAVYGGMGLLLLLALVLLGWGLWRLLQRLLSPPASGDQRSLWEEIILWWEFLCLRAGLLFSFFKKLISFSAPTGVGAKFYLRLVSWGKRCGLAPYKSETPREYGQLLSRYFPRERMDIEFIIDSFYREIYGGKGTKREQAQQLKAAWKKLRSPLKWPQRLKVWLYGRRYREIKGGTE